MTQGAIVLVFAEPSVMDERLTTALHAAGWQTILAKSVAGTNAALTGRRPMLVLTRLDPTSDLEFARDTAARHVPLIALLDGPEAMKRVVASGIRLDDAVFPPFACAEVAARIMAVAARRRADEPPSAASDTLAFSGWRLDPRAKALTDPSGGDVHLTPAELLLLEALVRGAGRVQSRDQLLDAIAGRAAAPFDRTIDNLVRRLRRKIEDDPAHPQLIITVPRFGYKFCAEPVRDPRRSPRARPSTPPHGAVVVLPLAATDPDNETLAASLTEDLIAELAHATETPVVAGGMAAGAAARRLGPAAVSRRLGGRYAIAGSVRREGSTLRFSAHLIDAANGTHVWTERTSIERVEPIGLQSATDRIVHTLCLQLKIAEGVRAELAGEADAAALLARGRAILLRNDALASRRIACRFFRRAVMLDCSSVEATAALGAMLVWNVTTRWSSNPLADQARAMELLRRVRSTHPHHSEAGGGLGLLLRWQGRPIEAIEILSDASERDRSDPRLLNLLGSAQMFAGRPATALPLLERGLAIGGSGRDVRLSYWALGSCHQVLGHRYEALAWLLKARAINPDIPATHIRLAATYGLLGEHEEASRALDAARLLVAPAARGDLATLAAFRSQPGVQHPDFVAIAEPTLYAGLRNAGMSEA
jgi:two-component system OmpR family response regulator